MPGQAWARQVRGHCSGDTMDRLFRATVNSWNGLKAALRTEAAFRQEVAVLLVAVPLAFVIGQNAWSRLALVGSVIFLMVVELLNTAIEKLSDRVSREFDLQIGTVKDLGSAAVGLALLLVGAVWLLAIAQRLGLL
jgi:diacylglycerol kinase (ATP)